jgi:autotransporter-associated beta strand protein
LAPKKEFRKQNCFLSRDRGTTGKGFMKKGLMQGFGRWWFTVAIVVGFAIHAQAGGTFTETDFALPVLPSSTNIFIVSGARGTILRLVPADELMKKGSGTLSLIGANTYSGGTIIRRGTVIARIDKALGSGNVDLAASGVNLTLQGGTTNNYISDNATLNLVTGARVNLNFNGTDLVGGLILGGIAQTAAGTYGGANSHANFKFDNFFSGAGTLTLVPEPSTWAMTIVGAGLLASIHRFRRKRI